MQIHYLLHLTAEYDVNDIDVTPIVLIGRGERTINTDTEDPITVGDHNSNSVPDLMVKFSIELSLSDLFYINDEVPVTVRGNLFDGTLISGQDVVQIF